MNTESVFCTHRSGCVVVVGECVQFVEQRLQHTPHLHVQSWLSLLPLCVVCCGRLTLLDVLLQEHDRTGQTVQSSKTTLVPSLQFVTDRNLFELTVFSDVNHRHKRRQLRSVSY